MSAPRDKEQKATPIATPRPKPTAKPITEQHADGGTRRPETPSLEGRVPLPEEITGRASSTDHDLVELFGNKSGAHITDGFRGLSDGEEQPDEGEGGDGVKHDTERLDEAKP